MSKLNRRFSGCLLLGVLFCFSHATGTEYPSQIDSVNSLWEKVLHLGGNTEAEVQDINRHRAAVALLDLSVSIWNLVSMKDLLIIDASQRSGNNPIITGDPLPMAVQRQIDCIRDRLKDLVPLISAFHDLNSDQFAETLNGGLRDKVIFMNDIVSQDRIKKLPGESDLDAVMREAQKMRTAAANLYLATTKAAQALDKNAVFDGKQVCGQ